MVKRRILAILLALAMLFSTTAAAAFAAEEDNGAAYITDKETAGQKLYEMGLMSGRGTNPDGTPDLALDKPVTRIETVAMLVNLLGHGSDLAPIKEEPGLSAQRRWFLRKSSLICPPQHGTQLTLPKEL